MLCFEETALHSYNAYMTLDPVRFPLTFEEGDERAPLFIFILSNFDVKDDVLPQKSY